MNYTFCVNPLMYGPHVTFYYYNIGRGKLFWHLVFSVRCAYDVEEEWNNIETEEKKIAAEALGKQRKY